MRIQFVTADSRVKTKGNVITASRWSKFCRRMGHQTRICNASELNLDWNPSCLIALHAKKTSDAIQAFDARYPTRPVVVMLTGTDIYSKSFGADRKIQFSIRRANRLVVLQTETFKSLDTALQKKTSVIFQSAGTSSTSRPTPLRSCLEVCVSGHLRTEKDPFRTALAAEKLPPESRIQVNHYGAALSDAFRKRAEHLSQTNPRYQWFGEYPRWKMLKRIARSQLLVLSSKSEGGASVLSEAIAAGTPVVASRIAGNIGILGRGFPGYFEVANTQQLRDILWRFETHPEFRKKLASATNSLKPRFSPEREIRAIRDLLAGLR